jgi:putative ABC transport system substrate-binding protein
MLSRWLGRQMQFDRLKRRKFITLLGGAAAAWPLAARAQQAGKLPTVGVLVPGTPATHGQWFAALVQRLRELGWVDGRNLTVEYRWAAGRSERFAEIAGEFVRLKVDVIATAAAGPTLAAKQATSVIPIVFVAGDPVGTGLVASLARPGGNLTGLSNQSVDMAAKRVELLCEAVPGVRRLAIIASSAGAASVLEMREVQAAAAMLGLQAVTLEVRSAEDISRDFKLIKGSADALVVTTDPLLNTNAIRINTLAIGARLPTAYNFRDSVEKAGFMSYGPNIPDLFRRAADYVDKVLRGAKPADIPVEQPTKFDLVLNLISAKALGVTVPPGVLARANEVIE